MFTTSKLGQLLDDVRLPPGIERHSADDRLLLLTGRRRELDQVSELWEADDSPGERDPASSLTLRARMETHIHKHRSHTQRKLLKTHWAALAGVEMGSWNLFFRLAAENLSWDVGAVLALNRDPFGPKGPLEVLSEQLILHASRGERQAVSKVIQTGLVHPDVADSRENTALVFATVTTWIFFINGRETILRLLMF